MGEVRARKRILASWWAPSPTRRRHLKGSQFSRMRSWISSSYVASQLPVSMPSDPNGGPSSLLSTQNV